MKLFFTIVRRRPAWTDRVLYRCNTQNYEPFELHLVSGEYTSYPEIKFSDHIPVSSTLELAHFSAQLAREKELPAFAPIIKFRTPHNWKVGYDGVVSYFVDIGKSNYLNSWDYIALFKVI